MGLCGVSSGKAKSVINGEFLIVTRVVIHMDIQRKEGVQFCCQFCKMSIKVSQFYKKI